jgi:hypothetical protein
MDGESRVVFRRPAPRRQLQGLDGQGMSLFRVERPQQGSGKKIKKTNHDALRIARTLSATSAFFKVGLDIPP